MRKGTRKLALHRETLRALVGGDLIPVQLIRLSVPQTICLRNCVTDPPSGCPPWACQPPEPELVPGTRGA